MSEKKKTILPKIRFQQFKSFPDWSVNRLGALIVPVEERAGANQYTLMSVTSGLGLIPQIEKFGREIAGSAYKNYYVIQKGDFAYNKSATKLFPEGYISRLSGYGKAALPNSIFTCFRIVDKRCDPRFFDHLFHNNYHGSWLRKHIEVGSRTHGSLNIKSQHLWDMPVAFPNFQEQQKIADCLSSLDELINAEVQKLELLKVHKKGLMQKMFPAEGETVPRLRFPEFTVDGDWESCSLGEFSERIIEKTGNKQLITLSISAGVGFVSQAEKFSRDISGKQYSNYIRLKKGEFSYNKGNSKKFPQGCIYELKEYDEAAVPSAFISFRLNEGCVSGFYEGYFESNFHGKQLLKFITSGARSDGLLNINPIDFFSIVLPTPKKEEQQKIADCLSTIDECITKQTQKIEALKTHKKGLMQGLFPSVVEVLE